MEERPRDVIRRTLRPLAPRPTGEAPRLPALPDLRAIVFDVYGTLLISASGDVGVDPDDVPRPEFAFREAVVAAGVAGAPDAVAIVDAYREAIDRSHARSKAAGIDFPEVDILSVWRDAFARLGAAEALKDDERLRRFALEYELRANPIWPMTGCRETIEAIRDAGFALGIVSNAQFYTPVSLATVLDAELDELGFQDDLCVYSFMHGQAKPGTFLYEVAADALARRDIAPEKVLYVGNDLLKDAFPASRVGFRTALFAGDARSLRKREDDERLRGFEPDAVVTELSQLRTYLSS